MAAWSFVYKTNLVWHKIRRDGASDGRGVGFYFRNVTELLLFGVRGKNARTLAPGRRQVNLVGTRKREHSRKPDEIYPIIEACSPGPRVELFARGARPGWATWGDQAGEDYKPTWKRTRSIHQATEHALPTSTRIRGALIHDSAHRGSLRGERGPAAAGGAGFAGIRLRAPRTKQRHVLRARIVLMAAEGCSTRAIARELGILPRTAGLWRIRFAETGLDGLAD